MLFAIASGPNKNNAEILSLLVDHELEILNCKELAYFYNYLFLGMHLNAPVEGELAEEMSLLHAAALYGQTECVRYLLKQYPKYVICSLSQSFFQVLILFPWLPDGSH
jgi:hypothetical protein